MSPKSNCKFCNKIAKTNIVKCVNCESEVHKYCCEKRNLEVMDDLVKCCDENDDNFEDAIGEQGDSELGRLRKQISFFKALLKEKNNIIMDKCVIIKDKEAIIKLLQEKNEVKNNTTPAENPRQDNDEPSNLATQRSNSERVTRSSTTGNTGMRASKHNQENATRTRAGKKANQMSEPNPCNKNDDWTVVNSKRLTKTSTTQKKKSVGIVGSAKIADVSAAPRKSVLFVSRLGVQTQVEALQKYVRNYFPEAECSALNSKHPEHYSSFKIIVDSTNYETAMDTDKWPAGAYIARFFQRRKALEQKG